LSRVVDAAKDNELELFEPSMFQENISAETYKQIMKEYCRVKKISRIIKRLIEINGTNNY
jgi:hypothetical protein